MPYRALAMVAGLCPTGLTMVAGFALQGSDCDFLALPYRVLTVVCWPLPYGAYTVVVGYALRGLTVVCWPLPYGA